jgi:PAS domain S-box-containing protein
MNPHPHHVEDELTDLSFTRLVDIEQIRELLEAHYNITGVGAAILDSDENTLVAIGYHDICTRFHLVHPLAKLNCLESDAYVKAHLSECKDGYLDYRCKNGLVDVAVPIIIRGEHLATFFTGHFFYDDDKPDMEYFRRQAEKFGYDENGYLEALGRVPIFTRDHVHKITEYNRNLVRIIAEMGLKNLELLNETVKRNQYEEELLLCRFCLEKAGIGIYCVEENGAISCVNDYACTSLGYSKNELCTLSIFDIDPVITREKIFEIKTIMESSGSATHESIHRRRDGTTFPVEITSNLLEFHGKTLGISFVKEITERKRAEEALRKSRQMLMSVLDNFPGVVFWKDRNSVYMGCNRNFSLAAGLSEPSEIIGRSDHELPWENDAERYLADDRQVMESGVPKLNIIEPLLNADGRTIWFETSKVPMFDADGKVFAVLGFSNDITERKRVEEELRCSEEKYRSIVDAYDGLIYICSQDYRIEFMNRKLIERTGYSAVSEFCYRVLHGRDSVCPWCVNGRVCAGNTVHWEILSPKDGRWYYVVNVPIYNANGTVSKHSVIADITERKQAEESLKRAKEEWERTFASLPELIAILDDRHRVVRVNEAMSERLGLKPDDYIGHPCYEAIHGQSDPHPFCPHTQTLKDGRKHVVEIHEERLGGDFLVSTTPLNDERGVMIGSVHIAYDITERKQIERMLSVKREQVAAMVVELSMAEERERLRIASVLHDHIGQTLLLSRIKLGTLAGIAKPDSAERVIEDVETLLDQVIDETHSMTIQLNPPILAVSGLEVALQWLGNRMGAEYGLVVEFSDDARAKPLSDELRSVLYQCTRELLINVVKHANTDRAWLRVGLEDGMFRLMVEDRGVGFNPDDIVPDLSRDCRFGIFSIQIRIERMGGRMEIESSPGSGTRIAILLPIKTTPP